MKPRETKDESMQRAESQSPLRCSSPESSEAPPDHCRKVVEEVGGQRQKAQAISGGSHANSVSDGTTRFQSLLSDFFPRFVADSCAMRTA